MKPVSLLLWTGWLALLVSAAVADEDALGDMASGESGSGSGESGGGSSNSNSTAVIWGVVGGLAGVVVVGVLIYMAIRACRGDYGAGESSTPGVATLAKIGAASRSGSLPMMPTPVSKHDVI